MDTVLLFIKYNFDLDLPCKLDYDGSGGKMAVRVALDREHVDLLRLFAKIGYLISVIVPGGGGNGSDTAAGASPGCGVVVPAAESMSAVQRAANELCLVRPLKAICRKIIRKPLGFGIHRKVQLLPLPPSLKAYILLEDILCD